MSFSNNDFVLKDRDIKSVAKVDSNTQTNITGKYGSAQSVATTVPPNTTYACYCKPCICEKSIWEEIKSLFWWIILFCLLGYYVIYLNASKFSDIINRNIKYIKKKVVAFGFSESLIND